MALEGWVARKMTIYKFIFICDDGPHGVDYLPINLSYYIMMAAGMLANNILYLIIVISET